MEKVSIVIPFYNCPFIGQAIRSALNQSYKNIEVIVVNDGSTKHTDKVTPYLSKVRYFEKGNGGTASALNKGIKHMSGKYFAWLSSDDVFMTDKIKKQIEYMKQSHVMVSHTAYTLINERNQVISRPIQFSFNSRLSFLKMLKKQCPINGSSVIMDKTIFNQVGLFDESLKFTQDYDMWMRVAAICEFGYLNVPLIKYRVHSGMGSYQFGSELKKEKHKIKKRYNKVLDNLIMQERKRTPE